MMIQTKNIRQVGSQTFFFFNLLLYLYFKNCVKVGKQYRLIFPPSFVEIV